MRFAGFACLIVVLGSAYWTLADDNERPGRRGADRQELLKRFDKNGDGRLDEEERIAARRQRAKEKAVLLKFSRGLTRMVMANSTTKSVHRHVELANRVIRNGQVLVVGVRSSRV